MFKILLDLCRQELFGSGGCHGKMVAAIAPGTEPLAWWRQKQIFAQ